MNIENLKVGMNVKNYKTLCDLLEVDVKGGNSKKAQLEDFKRYFLYEKEGVKFKITEIFEEVKEKSNNHGGKRFEVDALKSSSKLNDEWDTIKNGKIPDSLYLSNTKKYWWVCSACEKSIYTKVAKRFNKNLGYSDESLRCSYCSSSYGSKMIYEVLIQSEDYLFETEYSFIDLLSENNRHLRFDYALFKDNTLLTLIEYDGEYHDDSEKTIAYDKLKDNYCKMNGIPLLRIHHSEKPIMYFKLKTHFDELKLKSEFINKHLMRELLMDKDIFNRFLNSENVITLNDILKLR